MVIVFVEMNDISILGNVLVEGILFLFFIEVKIGLIFVYIFIFVIVFFGNLIGLYVVCIKVFLR